MDIITAICYIIKDIIAVISLLMIMHYIFLAKLELSKVKISVLTLVVALNSLTGIFCLMRIDPTADDLMDLISNIIYIFSVILLTNQKKLAKSIWIVMLYIMTVDMLYSLVSSYATEVLYVECIINILLFAIVCICIYFFAVKSKFNLLPKVFDEFPRWVFVAVMLFDLACYYKEFGISAEWYEVLYTVSSVMVIVCVLYLFFKIFHLSYEQNKVLRQIQMQSDYFSSRLSAETDLRNFRHDYKNHMIVVNAYLENGKLNEARDYLESINNSIHSSINNISTGNFVVDAVLNNKVQIAESKGIKIVFSGNVPDIGIDSQDLCLIFSNLLDNAIEACEKVTGEKNIEVEAGLRQRFFVLSISNPCGSAPVRQNGRIITTKKDKTAHGIGLKNVSATAEKYGGTLVTDYHDGVFSADVRLSVKQTMSVQQ